MSKVQIDKHYPHIIPFQNGLKQGRVLLTLCLNFALEYTIRNDQEKDH
jgi:hypothetical protein